MEQAMSKGRALARRPLATLARLHLTMLIGLALAFVYLQLFVVGEYLPIPTVLLGITLVIAALAAFGWRWTFMLGTLWLVLVIGTSANVIGYHLARPENTHDFAFYVVLLAIFAVGVISGVAAAAERRQLAPAPRWLPFVLVAITMLALGAIAVVLIPRPATTNVTPAVLAGLPALTTERFAFDQAEIAARAGETVALQLLNRDTATHAFAIPELGVNVAMHSGEASLALFKAPAPGRYTFYCSVPHHEAMRGTLVVTP